MATDALWGAELATIMFGQSMMDKQGAAQQHPDAANASEANPLQLFLESLKDTMQSEANSTNSSFTGDEEALAHANSTNLTNETSPMNFLSSLSSDDDEKGGLVLSDLMKEELIEAAKHSLMAHLEQDIPATGVLFNEKHHVTQCSDITSSVHCGLSRKMYGISCHGWGGKSCLDTNVTCGMVDGAGVCNNALQRLNISCAGWGGSKCLDHNEDASAITDEGICKSAELRLGIKTAGWGGSSCLSAKTLACHRITLPGICNDARNRLGINCDWGGSSCLSRHEATCGNMTNQHICNVANDRFGLACRWHLGACQPAGQDVQA